MDIKHGVGILALAAIFGVAGFFSWPLIKGSTAAPPKGKLRLVLNLEPEGAQGQGRLALHVINDGPGEVRIASGNFQPTLQKSEQNPDQFVLALRSAPELFQEKRRVVVPEAALQPLTLRANEEMLFANVAPLLLQLPEGKISLTAAYEVGQPLGERYNLWHGQLASNAVELTVNHSKPEATPEADSEQAPISN